MGQSVIQDSIICLQNKHYVKPSLREEITAMIVNNLATLSHFVLHLIYELQQRYTAFMCSIINFSFITHSFPFHLSIIYVKYCYVRCRLVEIYWVLEEWAASIFKVSTFYQSKDHHTQDIIPVTAMRTSNFRTCSNGNSSKM